MNYVPRYSDKHYIDKLTPVKKIEYVTDELETLRDKLEDIAEELFREERSF